MHFYTFSFPLQALLKLVSDCSIVALSPSRRDAVNESPLKIALFSLGKMCAHSPCRQFLRSSEFFHDLARLRQSPDSTIANYASIIINKVSETWNKSKHAAVENEHFSLKSDRCICTVAVYIHECKCGISKKALGMQFCTSMFYTASNWFFAKGKSLNIITLYE